MDTTEYGISSAELPARNRRQRAAEIIATSYMLSAMTMPDRRGPRRQVGTPKKHSSPKSKRLRKIAARSRAINRRQS